MKKLSVFSLIVSLLFVFSCEDKGDTTPPTVTIQSPVSGTTIGELVTIKVSTEDNKGILKVEFFIDNTIVQTDTESPYEYEWDTTKETDGDHTIKVNSYDLSENMTESQPVLVKVDNESFLPTQINIESVSYDLNKMTVQWSESTDTDFMEYNLHYSDSENGTKTLIRTITDKTVSSFDTMTFDPTKENWYFLEVTDSFGLKKMGNGKTNTIDSPPTKPTLNVIGYDFGNSVFKINWEQNTDDDFKSYILYESESEDMSGKSEMFTSIDISVDSFDVNSEKELYRYYQLVVEDKWGLSTVSDIQIGSAYGLVGATVESGGYLITVDINGRNLIQHKLLFNGYQVYVSSPIKFSKDGSEIIFHGRNKDGDFDIWKVGINGKNIKRLTTSSNSERYPILSPNGEKIAYVSSDGVYSNIFIMNSDGSNKIKVTNSNSINNRISFSPDGLRIVFVSDRLGNKELYSIGVDGTNIIQLTDVSESHEEDDFPSYSPSEDKIIFQRKYGCGYHIMTISTDGSNITTLTDCPFTQPVISPIGDYIVFYQSNAQIMRMNLNSGIMTAIIKPLNSTNYKVYNPSFNSTGTKLVYIDRVDNTVNIHTVNIDGTDDKSITNLNNTNTDWRFKYPTFQPRP